jgi:hypothetical protein
VADQARELRQCLGIEAEHLADLARRRFAAIGDDVRRHGGTQLAVTLVHIADRLLALVAGGQVEIDVRPLAAALAQEALEQQIHLDGIDGGDLKRVADDRVGGAAAALDEDAVALAVVDDVPDDEEVSGEAELLD